MKRPKSDDASVSAAQHELLGRVCSEYAILGEYLCATHYDDGTARETATLTVFLGAGVLTACLKDRATERTAWVSADSLLSLLDRLEEGLREDSIEWRADRRQPPPKPGRR